MKLSRRRSQGYLEELLHELRAINLWDGAFLLAGRPPDFIESTAWKSRRRRVSQICEELLLVLNRDRELLQRRNTNQVS
jgi:hypothetical protein